MITLLALSLAALAGDDWLRQPANLSNADVLAIYSGVLTARMNAEIADPKKGVQIDVILLDAQGRSHLQMLVPEAMVADFQNMPPGQQTAEMLKAHEKLLAAFLSAGSQKIGLFDTVDGYPSAWDEELLKFMKSRQPEDWIITIGFRKRSMSHVYASVSGGRVDFNPSAPTAAK